MRNLFRRIRSYWAGNQIDFAGVKHLSIGLQTEFEPKNLLQSKVDNSLVIGNNSLVRGGICFDKDGATIEIGSRTFIGGGSRLIAAEKIGIGDDILISWGVTIVDHNSHAIPFSLRANDVTNWAERKKDWSYVECNPVKIGNKCWIGFNVIILKGVTLGDGVIVGAGSVVTKSFPDWVIIGGNPARIIREIPENER